MMANILLPAFLLLCQSLLLFFLSRKNTDNLFYLFQKIFHSKKIVYILIFLIFLPGTIVHEFSHFFAAMVLFLPVKDIQIIPKIEEKRIKLGHVLYVKKDFLRGVLVGIAPFFGAILFFFFLSYFNLFPNKILGLNIVLIYLIFAVSSVMFSSKQDLVDIVYLLPFFLFLTIVFYVFQPSFNFISIPKNFLQGLQFFLTNVNFYLFISTLIHLSLILIFRLIFKP